MIRSLIATCLLLTCVNPTHARKPADVFGGEIILSTRPFPTSFKSDKAFIRHMKKVKTQKFYYGEKDYIDVEMMAFFTRTLVATEVVCKVLNLSDRKQLVTQFSIYPASRKNRILASSFRITKERFDPNKTYQLYLEHRNEALAQVRFSVHKPK